MPNNLNNFIANIETLGVARQNKYRVEINGPANQGLDTEAAALDLRCESITFPGTNVRSVPDTLRYGPAREHGQGMTYGPFTATFICSPDLREKIYFEWWQQRIINHLTWEAKYYDDYKGELRIIQLDDQNRDTYDILVTEAYPKTISPQDLSWSSNDSYQTVAVEFTYRYWLPTPAWMKAIGKPASGVAEYGDDFSGMKMGGEMGSQVDSFSSSPMTRAGSTDARGEPSARVGGWRSSAQRRANAVGRWKSNEDGSWIKLA